MNRIIKRLAVPLSAAAVLGTAGFAYMASNTVGTTYAGEGSGTISGYKLLDYHYNIGGGGSWGPTTIDSVNITLDNPAHNAMVRITDTNGLVHSYGCIGTKLNGVPQSGGGPWTEFTCSEPGTAYSGTVQTSAFFAKVYTHEAATLTVQANY